MLVIIVISNWTAFIQFCGISVLCSCNRGVSALTLCRSWVVMRGPFAIVWGKKMCPPKPKAQSIQSLLPLCICTRRSHFRRFDYSLPCHQLLLITFSTKIRFKLLTLTKKCYTTKRRTCWGRRRAENRGRCLRNEHNYKATKTIIGPFYCVY